MMQYVWTWHLSFSLLLHYFHSFHSTALLCSAFYLVGRPRRDCGGCSLHVDGRQNVSKSISYTPGCTTTS